MKAWARSWSIQSGLAIAAVIFHAIAFRYQFLELAVIGYLVAMAGLTYMGTVRSGFYLGLTIGSVCAAAQLFFFWDLFGTAAVALWSILGLWIGFFLATARALRLKLPVFFPYAIPFLWTGFEYMRSELYPLRFSWLTPGMALSHPSWNALARLGYYGFGFAIIALAIWLTASWGSRAPYRIAASLASIALLASMKAPPSTTTAAGPYVAGIQFEFADERLILKGLERLLREYPDAEIVVLSEYTFDGEIPPSVVRWCIDSNVHLVAGGKESLMDDEERFRNTVFVVSPWGEVIHKQTKSVPIQFFNDGDAAKSQKVWHSPWGPIGIAICYDLSYTRVMDRFVDAGARALIIPTMDMEDWGAYEHNLHAKIPYVRAREYGIPIFRVASSGVSQLVSATGETIASAPFPGPGKMLGGRMDMSATGRIPPMRWLAKFSVAIVMVTICMFIWMWIQTSAKVLFSPNPE